MPEVEEDRPRRRLRGPVLIALLVLVLAGLAAARLTGWRDDDPAPAPTPGSAVTPAAPGGPVVPTQQITLRGQRVLFSAPVADTPKAVIYAHGRGGDAGSPFRPGPLGDVTKALIDAGYLVAASDAHGDAWGDDRSTIDQQALAKWLRKQGKTQLYLLAESMGGLSSLRAAPNVGARAWAGIYPVCDLGSVTRFGSDIRGVWGTDAPAGLSPVTPPAGLPVMAWASPADTVVPKSRNADVCAAGNVVSTTGEHGDASSFDPAGVVAFFEAHP